MVSMPSWELFEAQTPEYKHSVLPEGVPVVSVEAAHPMGWERYSHYHIGMKSFGASAPGDVRFKNFFQTFVFHPQFIILPGSCKAFWVHQR